MRGSAGLQVGTEFLVAEDGQPSFSESWNQSRQVTRIAGPVVEIFVGDDAVDVLEIDVGGDIGRASTYLVLKMLRPLFSIAPMLKSPTATMRNGRGRIRGRSVLRPSFIDFLRAAMAWALVELARFDVDGELHLAAGGGAEGVAQHVELAGDDGEQVGRFLERVPAICPVAAIGLVAGWRPGCRWRAAPGRSPCRRAASPCRSPSRPGGRGTR